MKKSYVLAVGLICLIVCLIVGLAVCSEKEQTETPDVVGSWELSSVSLGGGKTMEADFPEEYDYSFELSGDGTATVHVRGVTYTTNYTIRDEWLTFSDADLASIKLEVSGDTMKMKMSVTGAGLVFIRQTDANTAEDRA